MTDNAEDLPALLNRIKTHIDQQFATGRAQVFLSSLGSELAAEKQRAEDISGLRFAEFMRKNFDYQIEITGEHKNVLFLVPAGGSTNVSEDASPRYNLSFWTAFAKPLTDGERRFLNLSSLRFGEKDALEVSDSDDIREIEGRFIATEETSRNVADMHQRIEAWLSEQSLDRDRFLARARKPQSQKVSLLSAIIDSLKSGSITPNFVTA